MTTETTQSGVKIEISADRLSAVIRIEGSAQAAELAAAVRNAGLRLSREKVDELEAGGMCASGSVVVVQGRAPIHDAPGQIELAEVKTEAVQPTDQNHYQRSNLRVVCAGQKLGRFIAPIKGRDGVDVCGAPLPHKSDSSPEPVLGPNVKLHEDGQTIIAMAGGVVRFENQKLSVEPDLQIEGNIDFSTGNIEFPGDIEVKGNVSDLFKLSAGGNVEIGGVVEAAEVHADGNLTVLGGIAGKDKGVCTAGGKITARYIGNARVQSGGDIVVTTEIANSRVACGGVLRVEQGAILSGHVSAAGGVVCHTLGSPAQTELITEVGLDPVMQSKCAADLSTVEKQLKSAKFIRQTVEPLMQHQKQLTAQQKEKATELLFNASQLEESTSALLRELEQRYQTIQTNSRSELRVNCILYAGTKIRFLGIEALVQTTIRGPLRVLFRQNCGNHFISVVSRDGSAFSLPAKAVIDPVMQNLRNIVAVSKKSEHAGGRAKP